MKSVIAILATTLLILSSAPFVQAQTATPAATGKTAAPAVTFGWLIPMTAVCAVAPIGPCEGVPWEFDACEALSVGAMSDVAACGCLPLLSCARAGVRGGAA